MCIRDSSLASQYVAAKYMGAESPAIIGSILSIIVIVIYGKLTASKEEKMCIRDSFQSDSPTTGSVVAREAASFSRS